MAEIYLFLALLGLLFSMLLSASEASIFSLSRMDLASLQSLGLKERYLKMLQNPDQLLFALLSGNELADYFASFSFAGAITILFSEEIRTPAFFIYALISFWLADFFPKVLGFRLRSTLVLTIIPLTYFLYQLFLPIRELIYKIYLFIEKYIPQWAMDTEKETFSPVEQIILHSLELAYQEKKISETEKEFIYGLFLSEKIPVSAIMTPRSEVIAFRDQPLTIEFMDKLRIYPYNKFPIYKESLDEVIGILYVKDILKSLKSPRSETKYLSELVRPAYFIPENFKVRDLLFEFQRRHQKIALLVDEYGTLKGLITLEDILEELFGEILAEKEKPVQSLQKLSEDRYLLSGRALLDEVKEELNLILDEEFEDLKTVNGFILALFKGIPKEGERASYKNWEFVIRKIRGRKILFVEALRKENV